MSAAADSPRQKRLAFVTFFVFFLVLGTYKWQFRQGDQGCSSITTPLSPAPALGHRAEHTPSATPVPPPIVPPPIPKRVVEYPPTTVLPLISKDIIVRSVFFDDRPRDGHRNSSVFMLEARQGLVDEGLVLGCQIGEYFGKYTKVRRVDQMSWVHHRHPYVNHDLFMVDCFDLPVKNRSRAFLFFKRSKSVESERPLFFPAPRISHDNDIKIVLCLATPRYTTYNNRLTVYGTLYHWLKYQRVIGVDHVHFTAHPSFVEVGSLQNDVIRKAVLDQFLSIEFWEPWLNETDNYHAHSQMLAYQDCAYRYRGTYDYIVICDTDEFFVPRIPRKPKFHYYIQTLCPNGACVFNRLERFPDCGLDQEKMTEDGNMTNALKSKQSKKLPETKSLYKSSMILDVGTHHPRKWLSGYSVESVPINVAYFAHIRHGHTPPSHRC